MPTRNGGSNANSLQSELSESLRAKAESLRADNEREKKEVYDTEREFEKVVEQERMRIEREVADEMKDRKWSVDREAQAKREAEAKSAEEQAKAEEEREGKLKVKYETLNNEASIFAQKIDKKVLGDFLPRPFSTGNKNEQGKNLNSNLTVPWAFAGSYERKMLADAPEAAWDAVNTFFESHADDKAGVEEALGVAYRVGASKGYDPEKPKIDIDQAPKNLKEYEVPTDAQHKAGLKNMKIAEKYIRTILKGAKEKDMRFDQDGNERA
jgi:hypothetical protein